MSVFISNQSFKDEDQEPEVIQKNEEEELLAAHPLESNESTNTPELIIFTLPQNIEEETTTSEPINKAEDGDNLLGGISLVLLIFFDFQAVF